MIKGVERVIPPNPARKPKNRKRQREEAGANRPRSRNAPPSPQARSKRKPPTNPPDDNPPTIDELA